MATQQVPIGSAPPNANKISIITKSEIRYEGILYHINPQDQNITLCNVKSFGTEGRRPGDEIAPSPQIHEYIIFRGTDIKDLKVLESAQQEAPQTENVQKQAPETSAPKPKETGSQEIQMKGQNNEEFDFQAMQQKFQQFTLDHKQPEIQTKTYKHDDFFDSLSTSIADKARDQPFDRIAQKKVDKETFGPEYVDNASRGRGGFRRGGGRGRGGNRGGRGGNYRGGYGGGYGGQNRNYEGQNRNYGGQGGYGGGHGGQGGYGGGQGGYGGHGGQGGYGGHGGQGGYGGQRKYGGGQGGYRGGHGGQGGYGGDQGEEGGYGGGQGGHGGQQGGYRGGRGGRGGYNSGPRYYKTYQTVDHGHDQEHQEQQEK